MTASGRARRLAAELVVTAMQQGGVFGGGQARQDLAAARAALLAYVADLEACVEAARVMANAVYAPSLTNDVKAALAALDRPEDGESK